MKHKASRNSRSGNESHFVHPTRRRVVPLALVVVIGVLVSLAISLVWDHWETDAAVQRLRSQFQLDARERVGAIRRELDIHLQVLRSMGALYQASEQVTREEFRVFAGQLLEAVPSIQALEWIPRVGRLQRSRYEEQARAAIPGFRIIQRDENGTLTTAPLRDEYFPVYFVEPYVGNESALGFDLASETVRREALHRARDSGKIVSSERITLVQETGNQAAVLMYLPIYRKGASLASEAQRRQHLEGFALVVSRVGDLIEYAIARLESEGTEVWVFDATSRPRAELLHVYADPASRGDTPRSPPVAALRAEDTFEIGGRQWEVIAAPAPGSFVPPVAYSAWLALLAGLLMTGNLGWYMSGLQRYGLEMAQAKRALDREVAEHRQTGAGLKKSEGRFRQILESSAETILISDGEGRIVTVNRQAERLFGYASHELIGQSVELLLPEQLREKHAVHRRDYYADPKQRPMLNNQELSGRRKDGTVVPLEISLSPTGLNEDLVVTAIIRDMTAQKAAERSLREAKEQAEAANSTKSMFLANISHEIRTPMNAVLGYTQIIEGDPDLPEKFHRPLKAIRTAGDHLMELIEEILYLSKIEAGVMKLEARDFHLGVLLEGMVEMFRIRCEQKQLQWESSYDIRQYAVRGDDKKLRQVLINILGNAIKFTDSGKIGIRVAQSGSRYDFSVKDTGPGITEEGRKRLFEPFQQAEEGAIKGGTGLGLTISRRQIGLMGGVLGLETTPGRGSRFYFSIELEPMTSSAAPLQTGGQEIVHLAAESRVRALVVDDVEDNREVLSWVLESAGIETVLATNGREALDKLNDDRIDVVFMDVRMPVMDGMTAIKHIRGQWPERRIPCIAITASGLMRPRPYYLDAGFDDLITKPFHFEKIWVSLEKHLGVVFEREEIRGAQLEPESEPSLLDEYRIPRPLRERLLRAAEFNALTDIESAIAELRGLGEKTHPLAAHLEGLLASYDTEGIVAFVRRLAAND